MVRQIVKGLTMLVLVIAVSLITAVVSANGQSSGRAVAQIPFEFAVGNQTLSAGEYTVEALSSSRAALRIRGSETKQSVIRLTSALVRAMPADKGKLVFHRYGNRYFLAEVWSAGESDGRQLMKSAGEKAIERELAANPSQSSLARSAYERVEILAVAQR